MTNLYDHIGRTSKRKSREISKLTEPLKLFFGIDRFWRNSHTLEGGYSVVGNCPSVAESFFGLQLFVGHPYFRSPRFFQSGFALPELFKSKDFEDTQGRLRGKGNCHHILLHIEKQEHGFIEYGFATSEYMPGFESIYLNNLHAIRQFISSFEKSASLLIRHAAEDSINMAKIIGEKYNEKPELQSPLILPDNELRFLSALEGNSEIGKGLLSLTKSEKTVLRHYLSGSITQEIAKTLFRSPRTIETHLENAKAKIGVRTRAQLFEILTPYIPLI